MIALANKRRRAGFTLIEIAIIIAVVTILGAVGATRFANMTLDAHHTATYNALSNMRSALAIAIAKNPHVTINPALLQNYIDPPTFDADTGSAFTWTVNATVYTVRYSKEGDSMSGITSITNTTVIPNFTAH